MEPMALESLVLSVWKLDGYLGIIRYPIQLQRAYPDIDVIGVRADGSVRIAECKATGPARGVYVKVEKWSGRWDKALDNIPHLWAASPAWLPPAANTARIDYYLVGNVWFETNEPAHRAAEARLTDALRHHLPVGFTAIAQAFVRPSRDLLLDAIRKLRTAIVENGWGKRYGDPLLDSMRELIRYANPKSIGGRSARRIREETRTLLLEAVFTSKNKTGQQQGSNRFR